MPAKGHGTDAGQQAEDDADHPDHSGANGELAHPLRHVQHVGLLSPAEGSSDIGSRRCG
jgi:hypothetical protein